VVFEADDHTADEGWSVILKGRARLLSANADILDAEEAPLLPWIATIKPHFVRVISTEITGRRFKFGPAPDRESTFACLLLRHRGIARARIAKSANTPGWHRHPQAAPTAERATSASEVWSST